MGDVMTEAREKLNLVSTLEDVRGTIEPSKQKLLDMMSAVCTNEEGAVKLYGDYSQKTGNQELKDTWKEFGEQTKVHVQVCQHAISALGGDPNYRSPVAKEIQKAAQNMLNIQAQGEEADQVRLGYLMQAEKLCHRHWEGVSAMARHVKDPAEAKILMDAARIVERDEDEHLQFNTIMFDRAMSKTITGM